MLKRLAACIREYKTPTILTLILIIGEAVIETFIPFITADMVNQIKYGAEMGAILAVGGRLVLMACLSLCCGGLAAYTCSKASTGFAKNLRHDMFENIQAFSFGNIDKFSSSSLVTRMTTDVANVQMSFMMLIRMAIRSPLMFLFSIIMAYYMGGALAATFVIVVPILVIGLLIVTKKAMPAFRSVFRKYDRLNESIEENVRGMRVVKGFAREDYEKQKFGDSAESIRKDFTRAERIVAINNPLMQVCVYFNMAFILTVGSQLIISNRGTTIDVGQLSAMITYGIQILMSLMSVVMIFMQSSRAMASGRRICEVLDEEIDISDETASLKNAEVTDGRVEFRNVSFRYYKNSREKVLDNINLTIEAGQTVGIIGSTGCGKTTLVSLIPRLYDADQGEVLIDGIDARDYSLTKLRDGVGMVLQKNLLFSGTIAENLRWGDADATNGEISAAADNAQADGFVRSFPDGYDTVLDQGGTNVSGGQKQRLCIARALLKRPKILILDDSTSAVDTATEAKIRQTFKNELSGSTKIIIAQRITSVMDADSIVVMDDGRITGIGTHEQLLRDNEEYKEIYYSQMDKEAQ